MPLGAALSLRDSSLCYTALNSSAPWSWQITGTLTKSPIPVLPDIKWEMTMTLFHNVTLGCTGGQGSVWLSMQDFAQAHQQNNWRPQSDATPSSAHQPARHGSIQLPRKPRLWRVQGKNRESPKSFTHMLSSAGRTFSLSSIPFMFRPGIPHPWLEITRQERRDCQLHSCVHWLLITGQQKWYLDMPARRAQSPVFPLYHAILKSLTITRHPAGKGVSI